MPRVKKFLKLPKETQRRQLKRLIYETVPEGTVKETAHDIGLEAYTLYKMRDGEVVNYNLIRPELINIMHQRRDLRILDFLESLFDRIAFQRPRALSSIPELNRQVTAVLKECTAAVRVVIDSVEPGSPGSHSITQVELTCIDEEITEAQAALEALRHAATELHKAGKK